ncbi:hypothetical protein RMCBS344292_11478 [Rhizopus microsporus]|nr:hypothetical protein RMCBS344292_11478 [Rhizopus microsporus]
MEPMVAVAYVLSKQETSLLGLEHRDDPTVKILYHVAKDVLKSKMKDEEKTIDVLLNVCENNHDQYKRILEAVEEDGTNAKRIRMHSNDGLLYNETCIKIHPAAFTSSLPEPLKLPQTAKASSSRTPSKTPLRSINSE